MAKTAGQVSTPKPVADAQADATKKLLAQFASLPLPELATGGSLSTYAQDLLTIGKIQLQRAGTTDWILLHDAANKDAVAKVHPAQLKAVLFTLMGFLVSPRTDRGYAYIQWCKNHKDVVSKVLGQHKIRVEMPKSTIPVLVSTINDLLAGVDVRAKILLDSVKEVAPTKSVGVKHVADTQEFDLIL